MKSRRRKLEGCGVEVPFFDRFRIGPLAVLAVLILWPGPAGAQAPSTSPPAGVGPQEPLYLTGGRTAALAANPVIRVYQDSLPWFGDNRDKDSLLALGKVPGVDYFVHPLTDLATGIPAGTGVVLITSNGFGQLTAAVNQNAPSALANLEAFVRAGGILVVDMGDNLSPGGFLAPGSVGTPDLILPFPQDDATFTAAAAGLDGLLGTADDHRIVRGPDGVAGTADDLTNSNVDACCYVAHGNLEDGITLPANATILLTALFNGLVKPIVAEYCLGAGRVILDTNTKEYSGQRPFGQAPFFMNGLLGYALSSEARCVRPVPLDIKPTSCPNPLNAKSQGVLPVAILGAEGVDVLDIDPASLRLEGVAPLRWALEDVATPAARLEGKTDCLRDCTTAGPDGVLDLTLKFDTQQIVAALGALSDGTCRTLRLTGQLRDGLAIAGEDVMRIQKKN